MDLSPKEEFINLMYRNSKNNGFDDLTSIILSLLYIEPEPVSMEELAKITGYSLSSVSLSVKFLHNAGLVKKIRKPNSKKLFLYMEKNMMQTALEMWKKKYTSNFLPTLNAIPGIIARYRKEKSPESKNELEIIQVYQKQIETMEKLMEKIDNLINETREEILKEEKSKAKASITN